MIVLVFTSCEDKITSVTEARKIVFCSDRTNCWQVYLTDTNGDSLRQLTNDTNNYYWPRFSPNGQQIIFYSGGDGNDDIFRINIDGSGLTNLTNSPGNDNLCRYSPDGAQIVFTSDRDGNREIYIMGSDGNNQTRLTNNEYTDHSPCFSNSGALIAFYAVNANINPDTIAIDGYETYDLLIMNSDGSNLRQLTATGDYLHRSAICADYTQNVYDGIPRFSPDDACLIFMTRFENYSYDIHSISVSGTQAQRLTTRGAMAPFYHPDGEHILFRTHRTYNYDIYLANLDGTNQINLTPNSQHVYLHDISSDGSILLLNEDDKQGSNYRIYTMGSDGSNKTIVIDGELLYDDYFPCFCPDY